MSRKSIQVKPAADGWSIKRSDSNRTAGKFQNKREATKAAREIASTQDLDVVIYEPGRNYTEIRTFDPNVKSLKEKSAEIYVKKAQIKETRKVTPKEKAGEWQRWAQSQKPKNALSDEAISRESIYGERG